MSREMFGLIIGSTLMILLAFSIRYANLGNEPIHDELYHVLAAASWSDSGSFAIADGAYTRAHLFTRLIGVAYGASDGDLNSIRLLCISIGSLLVGSVFLGVRLLVGTAEAYVAAIMLAMMPGAIFLSQFIRFYSLHALVFWLAAIAVYVVTTKSTATTNRLALCAVAAILLLFAGHLQSTTIIGTVGLSVWLAAISIPVARRWYGRQRIAMRVTAVSSFGLIVVLCIILSTGPFAYLLDSYQSAPLWSTNRPISYYFMLYRNQYGAFWSLFPLAVVIALMANWRPAFFCACVFVTAFLLHSFAGTRAERFLFYATPFFVTIWGITLIDISRRLYRLITNELSGRMYAGSRLMSSETLSASIVALSLACLIFATPATEITARMISNNPAYNLRYWYDQVSSWNLAKGKITKLVEHSDVFLTSHGLHAIYYIGDFDVEINATGLSDFDAGNGGSGMDPRTGRRVIADQSALQEILSCNDSGVVVVNEQSWRVAAGVNDEVADVIEDNMVLVETPKDWGMVIYQWAQGDSILREQRIEDLSAGPGCSR